MKLPLIDEKMLEERSVIFSEPTMKFSRGQSNLEGNKDKLKGLLQNGPFDKNTDERDFDKINIIPVVEDNKQTKKALEEVLVNLKQSIWYDKRNDRQLGFEDVFKCELDFPDKKQWYTPRTESREDFEKVARKITNKYDFKQGRTRNIVIFVVSTSSGDKNRLENSAYNGMKKILLEDFVPSQCLSEKWNGVIGEAQRKNQISNYTLINVACQIYAKIGGVPWVLDQPKDDSYNEITIGLRASVPKTTGDNYVYGIAQIFSQDGRWTNAVVQKGNTSLSSDSYDLSAESMKTLIERSIEKYENSVLQGTPLNEVKEITIHKLRGFSSSEIAGAKEFATDTNTEISLIGIQESNIRIYGGNIGEVKNTKRGYFRELNENYGILCTTGDYDTKYGWKEHRLGTPVPQLIKVYEEESLKSPKVEDVSRRIFHLTRVNWDDVTNNEISKPVSINYAGRVSKKVAAGIDISKINEDIPWFL